MALELPADVRSTLSAWAAAAAGEIGGLRPVGEASLHITLCFLGSQPEDSIGAIADVVRSSAAGVPPLLSLGAELWLPRRRPRVLTVELEEIGDEGALGRLQSAVAGALTAGGFCKLETRPFLSHVTVARVASGRRGGAGEPRPRLRPIALAMPQWPPPFPCRNVILYRSRLGSGPARYEPLATVTLNA